MMNAAHWTVLKRDYLYRFNRPRLDYVIYIICEHFFRQQENRLLQLINDRQHSHWWEEFKESGRKQDKGTFLLTPEKSVIPQKLYGCSCPSFLQKRFLLCKHLVIAAGGYSRRLN